MAQTEDAVVEELTDLAGEDVALMGEDMMYHLQRLRRHPLNINSASRGAMEGTMLFTPFQIESIMNRIASSGPILSFAELELLYGFDEKTVERIKPYVVLGEAVRRSDKFLKDESTSIYSRYQRVLDPASEQHLLRIRSSYLDRVDISAVIKGSSTQKQQDNYATGGLAYSGLKLGAIKIDKIVLGDFYARMGQGLAAWNGFSFSGAGETSGYARNAEPLSLYTSSDTSRLLRGGAVSVSAGKLRINAGYSFLGEESVCGLSYTGRRTRYSLNYFRKERVGSVVAADLLAGLPGTVVFAEGAWNPETSSFAAVGGASLEMEKVTLHFLLRGYGKDFSSPIGGAYSSLSKISNQQGVSLRMTGALYRKTSFAVGADYSAYPAPRYRVKDPSSTFKGYVKLSWDDSSFGSAADNELWIKGYIKRDVRYSSPREKEQTISLKTGGKVLLLSGVSLLLRGELNTLGGRAISSYLKLEKRNIGCTVGAAVFHVRDWAARIYFPEAELPYSFSSHLLYGQGTDLGCLVRIRPSRWLSLYLKYQYRRGVSTAKAAVKVEL
ncbi:MAG: hypothetical protein IJK74_00045 [Bacteroidales bacterium]|nr:hypothetical protein [Bacteroidales bacterium]